MKLYLVRWPDLSCTLVTAHDEDHLGYVLDEVGNPEGCRWTEYDGPVFMDFHLPVRITIDWPEQAGRPLSPEAVQIEDLDRLVQREGLQAEAGAGDTAGEMLETMMKFAFPATAEMYYDAPEEVLDESQWREALRADLMLLAEASWRRAHTERTARDDSLAKLAVQMDAPMELARPIPTTKPGAAAKRDCWSSSCSATGSRSSTTWPRLRPTQLTAVEAEPQWRDRPLLLMRHAAANGRLRKHQQAIEDLFQLCWRFPQQAALPAIEWSGDTHRAWDRFLELDPELEVTAFPAWLLIIRPALAGWLPQPDADAPEAYRLLYGLQREQGGRPGSPDAGELRLRGKLLQLDPVLFKHYIANCGA